MVEVDVTSLVRLREREKERFQRQEGVDLTLLPYFCAAVRETLREYPMLNARWEGEELRRYHDLNISVAVATETGLVTPVVHAAGDLSIAGLAKAIADLVQRAHTRKPCSRTSKAARSRRNNTGSFGSIASKPIVNYPQVAIVTMETRGQRPGWSPPTTPSRCARWSTSASRSTTAPWTAWRQARSLQRSSAASKP